LTISTAEFFIGAIKERFRLISCNGVITIPQL
jgi:hypothetical protein